MTLSARKQKAMEKKYGIRKWNDSVYHIDFCCFFNVPDGSRDPHEYIDAVYCDNKLDTIKAAVGNDFVMSDGGCTSDLFDDRIPACLVVFMFGDDYPASVVAHEAHHGTTFVLKRAGVNDEEAWAYYIQYLVKNILE